MACCTVSSDITPEQLTLECETRGKVFSSLDLAVQLIEIARKNVRICSSSLPADCQDVLKDGRNTSGVYQIHPKSRILSGPIDVYCDMVTDGGGWTVIQRRGNFHGDIDFYRDWESYKKGFGHIEQDFWLGNDNIFALSNQGLYSVRFDLQGPIGGIESIKKFALYQTFWLEDEPRKYTLHIRGYSGNAGDAFDFRHDGHKFSTKDQDNDNLGKESCSEKHKGGWWFNDCYNSFLNGPYHYHRGKNASSLHGVQWGTWPLETAEIKIRKKV